MGKTYRGHRQGNVEEYFKRMSRKRNRLNRNQKPEKFGRNQKRPPQDYFE